MVLLEVGADWGVVLRITSDGYEHWIEEYGPLSEESVEALQVVRCQCGETWQRGTLMTVEVGRQTPDAPTPSPQLCDLLGIELDDTVRRVGDDGVDAVLLLTLQPLE